LIASIDRVNGAMFTCAPVIDAPSVEPPTELNSVPAVAPRFKVGGTNLESVVSPWNIEIMRSCSRLISRRHWLSSISAIPVLGRAEPQNVVSPLGAVSGRLTPAQFFFVRNHFAEPELSLRDWSLTIEGKVARRITLSFSDLLESPQTKIEAVLECAGNPASGSAVSNGVWEGVSLPWLLDRAGPQPGVTHALLEGADSGALLSGSAVMPYSRLVPLRKCSDRASLVAIKLNGSFLPRRNGFPARALLQGWYAMDSVKWLRRIVVLRPEDSPAAIHASGMQRLYTRLLRSPGGARAAERVSEILVKSSIAFPADGARLFAGNQLVRGFAWTGSGVVRAVEVTVDGGRGWSAAKMEAPHPLTWAGWRFEWKAAPGEYVLRSRAIDDHGRRQPLERDPSREDDYELNWCAPVRCSVA
jgi:DMSO/TMAO reductase YedYZ molybdopterin-dependent catalytic subunit